MAERTKHQTFEYREIEREQIKNAHYNPNVMSDYSYKLLQKKIKDVGLLTTLVWNERSGNLVGGHHRLKSLDQLEGKKEYKVGVSVVNLSPKQEKEMNVFLNNAHMQGYFDKDLFFKMLEEEPLDLNDIGMTRLDLEMEFGELPHMYSLGTSLLQKSDEAIAGLADQALSMRPDLADKVAHLKATEEAEARGEAPPPPLPAPAKPSKASTPEEVEKMRAAKKQYRQDRSNAPENDVSYYVILRFDSQAEKTRFLAAYELPLDAAYATAVQLSLVGRREVME